MKVHNIKDFTKGWIVGDFEPTIYKNPHVEVAHHFHEKGFVGEKHTHKIGTELSYIVRGSLIASGHTLSSGQMFIYYPNEIACVEFLEDTDLVVIKWPSASNDKYLV
jgi:quercetin dioxygenase-like cupin family protein